MRHVQVDRRSVLGFSVLAFAAPLASSAAQFTATGLAWSPNTAAWPTATDLRAGYVFFTADEAAFIEAACARLVPADATGPSAVEAGVPLFLDRQLAGDYGKGSRWYMQGPFGKSTGTQGYQSRYPPAGLHRAAIKAIGGHLTQNGGQPFHKRAAADQDAFLKDLEAGKADLGGEVDGKAYFALLLQNVMEGYFSDPIYGGNRGMGPWKMIGFSGARYDQRAYVLSYGKPYPLPPVGIGGRPAWSAKG
ncbi:gluconate 2-dehydrogenase subunit 3 family protein [Phenylobacterium sp.]|uniref:gluconate 2-dehydrogenase subunit 3 family protein n=1 Tax=Phenylobacterium sp. TaxID=1871053 RepID=UPI0035633D89